MKRLTDKGWGMEAESRQWEERALRAAVRAGDESAWRVLYERHFDALYAHAYARVGHDPERAQEAVQNCWMTAVRRIRSFDPARGSFANWLAGIADRVLLGQRRRWARRQRLAQGAQAVPESTITDTPSEAAERVAWVLAELPKNYAAVLRAKYEERQPVAEIAKSWGRSV
ncbi:MAG: RNA polymerase sigma factor, partial [Candidatus Hydrogenedentes bacterium]|nr:RNA polymerase sigma factor [Candidatus Hydrogenedentota bacterium]